MSRDEELQNLVTSPYFRLRNYYERRPKDKPLTQQQEKEYRELVASFKAKNDEEKNAEQLFILASWGSPGAARALRGTPLIDLRRQIATEVMLYVKAEPTRNMAVKPGGKQPPSYVMPLAMGESEDELTMHVLPQAVAFRPQRRDVTPEDISFRVGAVEALGTVEHPNARQALLSVVVDADDEQRVRDACVQVLRPKRDAELLGGYRWVLDTSRKQALARLAREDVGSAKALVTSKQKYERVFDDLKSLVEALEERPTSVKGNRQPPAKQPTAAPKPKSEPKTAPKQESERRPKSTPLVKLDKLGDLFKHPYTQPLPPKASPPTPPPVSDGQSKPDQEAKEIPAPQTSPTKATPVAPAPPASGRQQRGERPKAGSDEGDSKPPSPVEAYCSECMGELHEEGVLSQDELTELQPAAKTQCVRCRVRQRA